MNKISSPENIVQTHQNKRRLLLGLALLTLFVLLFAFFVSRNIEFFPEPSPITADTSGTDFKTHYLIDFEYGIDKVTGFGRIPHLSVFNPGTQDAQLSITAFYMDRAPNSFELTIPAQTSFENSAEAWPVPFNSRFALKVESTQPVIVQGTQGWNNTANDYSWNGLPTTSNIRRETAKSYMALNSLAKECYIADGLLIDAQEHIWIKETEDLILFNPNKQDLTVTIYIYYGERSVTRFEIPLDIPVLKKTLQVPAERMDVIPLNKLVRANWHYGARITGDLPFAAHWLRMVYWYDQSELMSEWSVPCVQTNQ
jgi:hypothetical protein